jgi:hypothetical protein
MLLLTFSPRHDGSGHSKSFDSLSAGPIASHCRKTLLLLLFIAGCSSLLQVKSAESFKPSRVAANSCSNKLKKLEEHAADGKSLKNEPTRFSQNEVNSYLALDLSPSYHPCLKNLTMAFEEDKLQGLAAIDFDRLEASSSKLLPKLLSFMFSGTHTLSARGKLVSKDGKANFQLEQAYFDSSTLPKSLIEEIITLIGRKQKPPFDPLQPSQLPYKIQRIDVHAGYALVYQ